MPVRQLNSELFPLFGFPTNAICSLLFSKILNAWKSRPHKRNYFTNCGFLKRDTLQATIKDRKILVRLKLKPMNILFIKYLCTQQSKFYVFLTKFPAGDSSFNGYYCLCAATPERPPYHSRQPQRTRILPRR